MRRDLKIPVMMSKIADDTYSALRTLYPFDKIEKEYYINYKNTRLLFDFFIKTLNVVIEVQGEQHYKYVKHFHSTIEDFYAQKRRDSLKVDYCNENGLTLVFFYDKIDKINEDLILERLYEAMDG